MGRLTKQDKEMAFGRMKKLGYKHLYSYSPGDRYGTRHIFSGKLGSKTMFSKDLKKLM
jgi:hypothetical protein